MASVVSVCKGVHQSVVHISLEYLSSLSRHNYVTPTSYLELLSTYRKVLASKRLQVRGGVASSGSWGLERERERERHAAERCHRDTVNARTVKEIKMLLSWSHA